MDRYIFGPNVNLPSLPDMTSGIEKELLSLMKEVDSVFERRYGALLDELANARQVCIAQNSEIEKMTELLLNTYNSQNDSQDLSVKLKQCLSDLENLKKENMELKCENSTLQHKVQSLSEMEYEFESIKRSLSIQQEENKSLREKLSRSESDYDLARKIADNISRIRRNDEAYIKGNQVGDAKESIIGQIIEKYMAEKEKYEDDLLGEVFQEIDKVDKTAREIIS